MQSRVGVSLCRRVLGVAIATLCLLAVSSVPRGHVHAEAGPTTATAACVPADFVGPVTTPPYGGPRLRCLPTMARPAPRSLPPRAMRASRARRPAAPSDQRPVAGWLPGQEAWLRIPALGLTRRVYAGGQDTIDRGLVTHYWEPGMPAPVAVGEPGVYWLAGHHSTHGAPFAALTRAAVGDVVTLETPAGEVVTYRLVDVEQTDTVIPRSLFFGPTPDTPRLLIQTCLSETRRLLLIGVRA